MNWTAEQIELRDAIKDWRELLSADHIELDRQSSFSNEKWKHVCYTGLLGTPIEEEYGGLGQDLLTTMFMLEELGYVCEDPGLNFVISTHIVSTGIAIQRFGSKAQKQAFLPSICSGERIGAHAISEPNHGSDAFSMQTSAKKMNDHFLLNGSKTFVSNAPIADTIVVYAMTDKERGALGGCTAFLVDSSTKGLTIGKPIEKMGLKTAPMAELFFDNCKISEECVIGKAGLGFSIFDYIMKWEILCSFIINVGEMQRRLEKCIDYAKTRKQFGKPIGQFQSIAHQLVKMKIEVESSRDWLYRAGRKFQDGENAAMDIAIAKLVTSENNVSSALKAVQIFGGYGYMTEYGLEKELRQSVAGTIYSGTSEVMRNKIANLIGL